LIYILILRITKNIKYSFPEDGSRVAVGDVTMDKGGHHYDAKKGINDDVGKEAERIPSSDPRRSKRSL
jgi:hypothetical protein